MPRRRQRAVAAHAVLVLATLLVCLLMPRRDGGLLLVPLGQAPTGTLARLDDLGGLALLGPGPWQGTFLARTAGEPGLTRLLAAGILPLAVPQALCTAPAPARRAPARPLSPRGFHG
ncbi:hypothetical protein ACFOON_09130 [Novosphingobium piscinae]|uniref:Uncharacterized protein n=1 Tax=Novosphingobium piscinae TaxID=1507448 RepID=A0A7X1FY69_9SPHN|nr:hypothetical protein [Novosphingobium piscinae]MBC2669123.1 hypothetical protein [Novosphingobium piscinae]